MKKAPAQTYRDIDLDAFRNKLKFKALQEKINFSKKYPKFNLEKIREHSAKLLAAGAIGSTILLSGPMVAGMQNDFSDIKAPSGITIKVPMPGEILLKDLKIILPDRPSPLNEDDEKKLESIFKDVVGIPAKANLEGEHLNTTYGLIGAEQHLRRYPGDVMGVTHSGIPTNDEGMAPGLGAWGYFASSEEKLTPALVEDEKWYVVVQTLYLPDWQKRLPYLREWYKYRKVLVVNTINGNAVVGDIADSGPAAWTGKQFGGSPEVMDSLGGSRYKVGPVIIFFVDDPNNKIPLGPVDYNKIMPSLAEKM